jgi:hypothetical protein
MLKFFRKKLRIDPLIMKIKKVCIEKVIVRIGLIFGTYLWIKFLIYMFSVITKLINSNPL